MRGVRIQSFRTIWPLGPVCMLRVCEYIILGFHTTKLGQSHLAHISPKPFSFFLFLSPCFFLFLSFFSTWWSLFTSFERLSHLSVHTRVNIRLFFTIFRLFRRLPYIKCTICIAIPTTTLMCVSSRPRLTHTRGCFFFISFTPGLASGPVAYKQETIASPISFSEASRDFQSVLIRGASLEELWTLALSALFFCMRCRKTRNHRLFRNVE